MSLQVKPFLLAAALAVATTGSASAVTYNILGSSQNSSGPGTNTADVFAAGYAGNLPVGATWDAGDDPLVTPPPVFDSGDYRSPFQNTVTESANTTFFSVGGGTADNGGSDVSPRTLTFGSAVDTFTILWGSLDTYNTLTFLDTGGAVIQSFTGLSLINDSSLNDEDVALLRFDRESGDAAIGGVRFTSTSAAFEFALAPIPLPAGAWLLLTGVAGLGVAKRLRRT